MFEGDKGKNTGGMGAYSPSRLESAELSKKIIDKIIKPTLLGLKELKTEFKGFLYVGLMIINEDPYLIEYNVRMGDPECQTILPKLKTDFYEILEACVTQNLNTTNIEWYDDKSICVVLCSKGYPDQFRNEIEIAVPKLWPSRKCLFKGKFFLIYEFISANWLTTFSYPSSSEKYPFLLPFLTCKPCPK